jgi:hypothetical protein
VSIHNIYNISVTKAKNIETARRLILISKALELQNPNIRIDPDSRVYPGTQTFSNILLPNNDKKTFNINEKINELKFEIQDIQGYIHRPWDNSELCILSPGSFSGVRPDGVDPGADVVRICMYV